MLIAPLTVTSPAPPNRTLKVFPETFGIVKVPLSELIRVLVAPSGIFALIVLLPLTLRITPTLLIPDPLTEKVFVLGIVIFPINSITAPEFIVVLVLVPDAPSALLCPNLMEPAVVDVPVLVNVLSPESVTLSVVLLLKADAIDPPILALIVPLCKVILDVVVKTAVLPPPSIIEPPFAKVILPILSEKLLISKIPLFKVTAPVESISAIPYCKVP